MRPFVRRSGLTQTAVMAGLSLIVAAAGFLTAKPLPAQAQQQQRKAGETKNPGAPVVGGLNKGTEHERAVKPTLQAAAAGDREDVLFNWMWYMGMLRESNETDHVATFELLKSTGTIDYKGQPCKLQNFRESLNYQTPGMRTTYSCTLPNGQMVKNGEVVSGQFSWDEDVMGAGLEPGRGTATPRPDALVERQIRLWTSPQGSAKAAFMGGANTKVSVEGGKPVVTYPIPGVPGVMAKATLNSQNQAEKIEVTQAGKPTMEFDYDKYGDYSPVDDRIDAFSPGHIVEKKNGMTILDINVALIMAGNLYVVMPVPANVGKPQA